MKKNNRTLLYVGIGCAVVALLCVCTLGGIGIFTIIGANAYSQPLADAGDAFLGALRDGNYAKAYSLCSTSLQRQFGNAQGLQRAVESSNTKPKSWSFSSRNVVNDNGTLQGNATLVGGEGTVELGLVKVGDTWKIDDVSLKFK